MAVDTKTVEGRRELRFGSVDDLLTEIDRLTNGDVKMLGNWSLAQMFKHLAAGFNSTIDGTSFKVPFFFKLIGPFMKKKFLSGKMPSGFKIPDRAKAQFQPSEDAELSQAASEFRAAVERIRDASEGEFARHPMFGNLTKDENIQFHLRHSEMHLSFALPQS